MTRRTQVGVALLLVVAGIVVGTALPRLLGGLHGSASIQSFQRTGDPRMLVLNVMIGLADEIVDASAREGPATVTVSVRVRSQPGTWPAVGIFAPTTVKLAAPLGERSVLDERGARVLDLGTFEAPRQPPIDLGQVSVIQKGSFAATGGFVDLRWRNLRTGATSSLADLRGRTVVLHTRTSFSNEGKITLGALQELLDNGPGDLRERVVVVVVTLAEDPSRAAVVRPGDVWRPLVAFSDAVDLAGGTGPEILQLRAVPVTWFIDPSGVVRRAVSGRALTRDGVADAIAAAR